MLEKLKNIFRKIFNKSKMLAEPNDNNTNNNDTRPNNVSTNNTSSIGEYFYFEEENMNQSYYENNRKTNNFRTELSKSAEILNVQKRYDEDIITEDDLTISQIKGLISLYDEQIRILETNIKMKKSLI